MSSAEAVVQARVDAIKARDSTAWARAFHPFCQQDGPAGWWESSMQADFERPIPSDYGLKILPFETDLWGPEVAFSMPPDHVAVLSYRQGDREESVRWALLSTSHGWFCRLPIPDPNPN